MLDWIIKKWNQNKGNLEAAIRQDEEINTCRYSYLVKLVVHHILNDSKEIDENDRDEFFRGELWNVNRITEIDDGDYQGMELFFIPRYTVQPQRTDYLYTYQDYGSCGGCDTLLRIQEAGIWEVMDADGRSLPTESQVKDYLLLCQHLVCSMKWLEEREENDC